MEHANPAIWALFIALLSAVLWQISRARAGKPVFLRRIAGLDVIDDAIGRATEMGRPVMFNPGLSGVGVPLFVSLSCLKHVTERAARLDMPVHVPVFQPVTYPLAEEFWKEAYTDAGRPDIFRVEDCVRYFSADQAAFAAATSGWIHRDKPGAHFMFGEYGWESLFIAEAGQRAGAIQVAATFSIYQVPFFIVSCDYTAFGEEFYAAGAYFSREPVQVGSVKGQDMIKIVILALIVVGCALAIFMDPNPLALLLEYQ